MPETYTQAITNVSALTIPQSVHQLHVATIQVVLYTFDPLQGRSFLTPS